MSEPRCPICAKPSDARFKPFCSGRCAQLDLGRWLGGKYVIAGPEAGERPAAEPEEPDKEP